MNRESGAGASWLREKSSFDWITIPSLYNAERVWCKLVLRELREGQVFYHMRHYDPRFLLILGRTTHLHNVERENAHKCLYEIDLLLDKILMAESKGTMA